MVERERGNETGPQKGHVLKYSRVDNDMKHTHKQRQQTRLLSQPRSLSGGLDAGTSVGPRSRPWGGGPAHCIFGWSPLSDARLAGPVYPRGCPLIGELAGSSVQLQARPMADFQRLVSALARPFASLDHIPSRFSPRPLAFFSSSYLIRPI